MNKNLLKLAKMLLQLASLSTDKGVLTYEGELAVGTEVFLEDENGELKPADDGEYATDENILVVEGGKVAEIRDREEINDNPEQPEEEPAEEPAEEEQSEEEQARIAELEAAVAVRDAKIAELEAELEALRTELETKEEMLKQSEEMSAKKRLKMNKEVKKDNKLTFSQYC